MENFKHIYALLSLFMAFLSGNLFAQQPTKALFQKAENLRKEYRFQEAMDIYEQIRQQDTTSATRSAVEEQMALCQNGESLLQFVSKPVVLGKKSVQDMDFFLWIDCAQGAYWCYPPQNILDKLSHKGGETPMLVRPGAERLVFSVKDSIHGNWDIFFSYLQDNGIWSAPERMDANVNSNGDEMYPVLSADGNTLYFSSNGLSGLGGFDLYKSVYNSASGSWSPAENLGIPYSSPEDDFAFVLSNDESIAYFVSARGTVIADSSLYLYKVENELDALKYEVAGYEEIKEIALLKPVSAQQEAVAAPEEDEDNDPQYVEAFNKLESLKGELEALEGKLSAKRKILKSLNDPADKGAVTKEIMGLEQESFGLQGSIVQAQNALRKIELQLLSQGVVVKPIKRQMSVAPVKVSVEEFNPQKQKLGTFAQGEFEEPVPEVPPVNLTFRKEEVSDFVTFEEDPQELYYRIQVLTVSKKQKSLKGYSPAFELRKGSSYIYQVGFFGTFKECQAALNNVKKVYQSAFTVAYYKGSRIQLPEAKKIEAQVQQESVRICLGSQSDGLSSALRSALMEITSKDISLSDGKYYVGPFSSRTEAAGIVNTLVSKGFKEVAIE